MGADAGGKPEDWQPPRRCAQHRNLLGGAQPSCWRPWKTPRLQRASRRTTDLSRRPPRREARPRPMNLTSLHRAGMPVTHGFMRRPSRKAFRRSPLSAHTRLFPPPQIRRWRRATRQLQSHTTRTPSGPICVHCCGISNRLSGFTTDCLKEAGDAYSARTAPHRRIVETSRRPVAGPDWVRGAQAHF